MFARVVEFTPVSGAAIDFVNVVEETALRLVKVQAGCIGAFVHSVGRRVIGVSLWESSSAADRYQRVYCPAILAMLRPYLAAEPKVYLFSMMVIGHEKSVFGQRRLG